jgi:hypothetical protein
METPNVAPIAQPVKIKVPFLVLLISWVLLFGALVFILSGLMMSFSGIYLSETKDILLGTSFFLRGIFLFLSYLGLRKLEKSGLFLYELGAFFVMMMALWKFFFLSDPSDLIGGFLGGYMGIYFFNMRDKFSEPAFNNKFILGSILCVVSYILLIVFFMNGGSARLLY